MNNSDTLVSEKVKKKSTKKKNDNDLGDDKLIIHPNKKTHEGKETSQGKRGKEKETIAVENAKNSQRVKKCKRVSFPGPDEAFPSSSDGPSDSLVRGKRFTPEEDKVIKEAVFKYVEDNDLGEDGVNVVLHCKSHTKIKNCWLDIGLALPYRPYTAMYDRAHNLFERDETSSWTNEELELIRNFHDKHGPKWRQLADIMGKHRRHLKDQWRRIKLLNPKKGHWSRILTFV